jgi:sulfoxide reductase heme-binding subunit YedZ
MAFLASVASTPSPLWFATRGAGVVTLVLLTATVVLGVSTSLRVEGRRTPRFVTATLHRNLSLFTIVLLTVHIATSVLDPFAGIRARDAVIPFAGTYRPTWLGLGVLAAELLAAVAVTSLARGRIGGRAWRLVHWTAYASWPLAVVHGLGTGSDAQAAWMVGITAACAAAVVLAVAERLVRGAWRTIPLRLLAAAATAAVVVVVCGWAARGPLQPGWAAAAGTPATILKGPSTPSGHRAHPGPGGFADGLVGSMVKTSSGTEIGLRDVVDPTLTLSVMPPDSTQTQPVVTVERTGHVVCVSPARVGTTIYAVCGTTRLVIELFGTTTRPSGELITTGPLG